MEETPELFDPYDDWTPTNNVSTAEVVTAVLVGLGTFGLVLVGAAKVKDLLIKRKINKALKNT